MINLLNTRRRRIGAIAAVCVFVILLAGGVFALGSLQKASQTKAQNELLSQVQVVITPEATTTPVVIPTLRVTATPVTPTPTATPTLEVSPTPVMALNPMPVRECAACTNVLLLGIDQRPTDDPNTTRSDTMIILSLDTATHSAGMLSLPRDLYVPMPNTGRLDRINTAMAYGGPSYAMKTVEYNTGIQTQHYVRINFNAVVAWVDLVGGIEVNVDQDINDPTYPDSNYGYDPFVLSKGWQHLDGATALKYARTRHQTSDFYRLRRQQQIIIALRDRVLSTNAISTLLSNAPSILSTLSSSIDTDLSATDMIQLLMSAKDISTSEIKQVTVDETAATSWTTPNGGQVLLPNRERIRELAAELYNQTAEPERIALQNGTSTQDLAATAQSNLLQLGYNVVQVSDAQNKYDKSVIVDYLGNYSSTVQLASALGLPTSSISSTMDTNSNADVQVILGDDYKPRQ
jgi:LCP family protein required for cell wall assembly